MDRAWLSSGRYRRAVALLFILPLSACYTFQAVPPSEASPGEELRLVLAGPAPGTMAPAALMGESLVQGNLVELTEDSISVSVWIGQAYRGTPFETVHQAYSFPRVELVRVERSRLSKPRTALATIGVLAGIYFLIDRLDFLEDPNPGTPGDDNEPPDNPFFRWH